MRATYRVQMHAGFTFDDAASVVDYIARLGVSHLYCSPYLQAAPGSTHGYDVVDHTKVNEELGGAAAHARMTKALQAAGLGQVLDIVPNHMALAGRRNAWWWDVLENGPASQYAAHFDIDWDPPESKLQHRVLVPVLGDHYGRVLEAGELVLGREGGSFIVTYHEHEVPVSPRSLDDLVMAAAERLESDELASIATALGRLPHARATDRASVTERHRDKEVLRANLARLCEEDPAVAAAVDDEVAAVNDDPDRLDLLLSRQNYRLAYWRTAGTDLDYRRFFDITSLVALRIEDDAVFDDVHRLVLEMVAAGQLDGLRIDHVDGLRDPKGYLERLRDRAPGVPILVEKILERGEELPGDWPVAGTTGYDFMNELNGLFVDPAGEEPLTISYERFTGEATDYDGLVRAAKYQIMTDVLAADIERLVALCVEVTEGHRRHRDHTRADLRTALKEIIAAFHVYRTYVRPHEPPSLIDVGRVEAAVREAAEHRPDLEPQLFEFLADVLLLRLDGPAERELALRFQQVSSPVMAKGVEDTAFYRFHRLVSLNEVGGDPSRFGVSVEEWHRLRADPRWRGRLLATSTHDTKRSEDVRARLDLLSEIPLAWEEAVWRWAHRNDGHRRGGQPDRAAEYLLYQALVGAWPLTTERAVAYMEKASKEAKVHTSWIDPDPEYDEALRSFVAAVMADAEFADDLERFVQPLVGPGRVNSLAQTALKLLSPGVPDLYQGTELWDLSLVDPDNRRPVDYDLRRRLLDEVDSPEAACDHMDDGAAKQWLTRQLLALGVDPEASYEPLVAAGAKASHAVAFVRGGDVAVVVPRLVIGLAGDWADTVVTLPHGSWASVLGRGTVEGGDVRVAELTSSFPVAVLRRS